MLRNNTFLSVYIALEILFLVFFGLNFYYQVALAISSYQFLSLLFNIGNGTSIRNLVGTVYSLNYLFSPVLMYSWLNNYTLVWYRMKGSPDDYFSYAIPAMLLFLLGLNLGKTKKSEYINTAKIKEIVNLFPKLPLHLIIIGYVASFAKPFIPSAFAMVAAGLSNLMYVGFFLHILSGAKFNYLYFILSYGYLTAQSLLTSMFNDFLNMLFFLGIILAIRYKPKFSIKLLAAGFGVLIVTFIQIIKFPLRERLTEGSDFGIVNEAVKEGVNENEKKTTDEKVADVVFRACQAWITSNTMLNYKQNGFQLQNGSHSLIILQTALLPSIIAPDRYKLGDVALFNKYSGHFVQEGTSMALGVLSDAFIDYGYNGIYLVFIWGLIFNFFIRLYYYMEKKHPLAQVFSASCFFYAIRPDTDTYGALGSLIKITFILWFFLIVLDKAYFTYKNSKLQRIKQTAG